MIFFVPSQDPATLANLIVAQNVCEANDNCLFALNATLTFLHQDIQAGEDDLFLMEHGSKNAIIDQTGDYALLPTDASQLSGRKVFAWACWTGVSLGYLMAKENVTWWGYDRAVTAPDDHPQYADIFKELFLEVKTAFIAGLDSISVDAVLNRIRAACVSAIELLDDLGENSDEYPFAPYSCCNQLWERLTVWLAGADPVPRRHANSPPPYIEI